MFLKTCEHFFWTYYLFSQIKNKFRKFWELLSNNTIQDAFCKKVAKVSNFSKKSSFFPKKNVFFSKKCNFWTFWELLSFNTFRDALRSFFLKFCVFEKIRRFFQKNSNSKRFEIFWSTVWNFLEFSSKKTPFETHSIVILPISAIFRKNKQFFEITHLFSRKSQAVERFEFSWAMILFQRHSLEKDPCLAFLKTFKCFFEKKTYLFPKNPEFWTSSEYMSNSDFRDAFEEKLAKLIVLESFQNVFFQAIYLFF